MVYLKKGVNGKALKRFQQILQQDPDNPTILYNIGICYNRMDQPKKSIPPFTKVTEIQPSDGKAYYYLGVAYDKTGFADKARENYRVADEKFQKGERRSETA